MKRVTLFALCLLFSYLFIACRQAERKPFYQADISGIVIDPLHISRYEKVLFQANPFILYEELTPYYEEFEFFLGDGIHQEEGRQQLYNYVTDPLLMDIYMDSRERIPDLEFLKESLHEAFRYYLYHFPGEELPRLYTYISGIDYNMPVFYEDAHLVIGIDNYLGKDYPLYDQVGIPRYLSHWMRPEMLAPDVMRLLAGKQISKVSRPPESLLDHMVHQGKKLYFLDCTFPALPDSLKIAYTSSQMQWMRKNEANVWLYLMDNELLYNTDREPIGRFIRTAPFTSIFSRESAPRTGAYIGWQIVREYMRRNPDISLEELIHESDARKVLRGARYRPR